MYGKKEGWEIKEEDRNSYWKEYYTKFGIEYKPTRNLYYLPITYDLTFPDDGYICNSTIEFLLSEFKVSSKNILSYSKAIDLWIDKCNRNGLKCSRDQVQEAYTLAYGYGCEYEFKYL